jgi:hypothetical protein
MSADFVEARQVRRLGKKDVSKWGRGVAGNSSIGVDIPACR